MIWHFFTHSYQKHPNMTLSSENTSALKPLKTKNPPRKRGGFYFIKVRNYTLISTSTPLGNSNFIKASIVFEEEL